MLIGLTQQASEFVIASPLGRGNLLVECCKFVRSTRRFPRRFAPRNDILGALLNKTDKHISVKKIPSPVRDVKPEPFPTIPVMQEKIHKTGSIFRHFVVS